MVQLHTVLTMKVIALAEFVKLLHYFTLDVLVTTLFDKVCQWLVTGRWFSLVSPTNKTDSYDITEILLKVLLNTITLTPYIYTSTQCGKRPLANSTWLPGPMCSDWLKNHGIVYEVALTRLLLKYFPNFVSGLKTCGKFIYKNAAFYF